jgi:hypothetical protein
MRKSSAVIVMTTYWKKPRASISKWCFFKTMGLCRYLIMEQRALIYLECNSPRLLENNLNRLRDELQRSCLRDKFDWALQCPYLIKQSTFTLNFLFSYQSLSTEVSESVGSVA